MKNKSSIIFALLVTLLLAAASPLRAAQTDLIGPTGSGQFGTNVTVLPNGNIVVTDPSYSIPGGAASVGAVHLYDGATLALISTLTGSKVNDLVGDNGVTVLTNGNYIISSPNWNNGTISEAGAVTFGSGATGVSGIVSASNSLVGSSANDAVGNSGVVALTNGNYVVRMASWDNGAIIDAGAVTFGNGTTGISGAVSASNSLIGSSALDYVGNVTTLTNGNYVISSPNWNNAAIADAGAVTFGNGASGTFGTISATNSLVGSSANDYVGSNIIVLNNGNYVVNNASWNNGAIVDAGAATFGNGRNGTFGTISASNSLIGSKADDFVGNHIIALTNGNYVVSSVNWDNGAITDAGAATFGNGMTGVNGAVSASNSLVGSTTGDGVGSEITALANGNYVVSSPAWNNGAIIDAGAATFSNGVSGIFGTISAGNSLVGSTASDFVGNVTALTNGNYVVSSPNWNNDAIADAGAVTFGIGASGISGTISASNSLVGSTASDQVGSSLTAPLTNGNYVVNSPNWDNGTVSDVGAATLGNGVSGTFGTISASNSLIGSTTRDFVGNSVIALNSGNYVVNNASWNNGAVVDAGAVTFGNGVSGTFGAISAGNSLVGSTASDFVGNNGIFPLTNGNYLVSSVNWDNGAVVNAGAATFGNGVSGISGTISASNSLVGLTTNDVVSNSGVTALNNGNYIVPSRSWDNPSTAIINAGAVTFGNGATGTVGAITSGAAGGNSVVGNVPSGFNAFAFDATRNRLVVGRRSSNTVSILSFTTTATSDGDLSSAANFNNGAPNALVNAIIPSGRTMTVSSKLNIGQVQMQCGGSLTGGSSAAYIIGSVRRDFCQAANESFVYPLGDANNYTPLMVSNTSGTGALTAAVTDNFLLGLPSAKSLSRYWSLTGAGITTTLTFNYVDADVNGTETNYRAFKRNSSTNLTVPITSLLDPATNTFTVAGVSQFSDWSAGDAPVNLSPTAAGVSISGRVSLSGNRNLMGATVYLTTADGETVQTDVSWKGDYQFDGIAAGQTVMITVFAKRYRFEPQIINITEDLTDVNFAPLP